MSFDGRVLPGDQPEADSAAAARAAARGLHLGLVRRPASPPRRAIGAPPSSIPSRRPSTRTRPARARTRRRHPRRHHRPRGRRRGLAVARERFPEDRKGQITHQLAMKVSDSAWHRQLSELGERRVAEQRPVLAGALPELQDVLPLPRRQLRAWSRTSSRATSGRATAPSSWTSRPTAEELEHIGDGLRPRRSARAASVMRTAAGRTDAAGRRAGPRRSRSSSDDEPLTYGELEAGEQPAGPRCCARSGCRRGDRVAPAHAEVARGDRRRCSAC